MGTILSDGVGVGCVQTYAVIIILTLQNEGSQ